MLGSPISWCFFLPDGKSGVHSFQAGPHWVMSFQLVTFWSPTVKKKKLVHFYNTAWLQYQLPNREFWPLHRSLNNNTIFQFDVFCKCLVRWSETPCLRGRGDLCQKSKLTPTTMPSSNHSTPLGKTPLEEMPSTSSSLLPYLGPLTQWTTFTPSSPRSFLLTKLLLLIEAAEEHGSP